MQANDDLDWLHAVRAREVEFALRYFPINPDARVLELGSGTGYALGKIRECYPNVSGLEVQGSSYSFVDTDIQFFDGKNIPFDDETFDVVFSSHVLEHVPHIDELLSEIFRVLKPGGVSLHVLPSPTWRVFTSLFHYVAVVKLLLSLISPSRRAPLTAQAARRSKAELIRFVFYAPRHGERGSVVTEVFFFSRSWWKRVFEGSKLEFGQITGVGFLYCGRDPLRFRLSFNARRAFAHVFGSASNLCVSRKIK